MNQPNPFGNFSPEDLQALINGAQQELGNRGNIPQPDKHLVSPVNNIEFDASPELAAHLLNYSNGSQRIAVDSQAVSGLPVDRRSPLNGFEVDDSPLFDSSPAPSREDLVAQIERSQQMLNEMDSAEAAKRATQQSMAPTVGPLDSGVFPEIPGGDEALAASGLHRPSVTE